MQTKYVRSNITSSDYSFIKGRIYVTRKEKHPQVGRTYIAEDSRGNKRNWHWEKYFVPATRREFLEQPKLPRLIESIPGAGYEVIIRNIKSNYYDGIQKVISIGCSGSCQFYSLESMKTILCVMKQYGAGKTKHCKEDAIFTPTLVRGLIKMLEAYPATDD